MLSHGQFRISLCLGLDRVPGVCSVSGIQAGKSVHSGRLGTAGCPRSAQRLGRSEHTGHCPRVLNLPQHCRGHSRADRRFGLMHVHYKSSACVFAIVCLNVFEVVTDPVF